MCCAGVGATISLPNDGAALPASADVTGAGLVYTPGYTTTSDVSTAT